MECTGIFAKECVSISNLRTNSVAKSRKIIKRFKLIYITRSFLERSRH